MWSLKLTIYELKFIDYMAYLLAECWLQVDSDASVPAMTADVCYVRNLVVTPKIIIIMLIKILRLYGAFTSGALWDWGGANWL